MAELKNRYDFVLLFDVKDGNPNGDPDAGNLPRIDPETSHGLVTDVCLKRKVRNYISLTRNQQTHYDIFIKEKGVLNTLIDSAYEKLSIDLTSAPKESENGKSRKKSGKAQGTEVDKGRAKMCQDYFDIRAFGAVMSTGANAGQVRGPVQLTFARSIDPIVTLEHSITRMAVATEKEAEDQGGDNRTIGRKNTIPYGLYLGYGFISPQLARQTGFSEEDLSLLWEAFEKMFEFDRSAARGLMAMQKLYIFRHASELGNAPSHKLFDCITVQRKVPQKPPRTFDDYLVEVAKSQIPPGIELYEKP